MESLEMSAKTVEEATQRALEKLGVSREEVEVTVVKEGRSGILGLGAEEATVQVRALKSASGADNAEIARDILEALIVRLGVDASVVPHVPSFAGGNDESAPIAFDIEGDDLGILIGRRGQTLSCLQYILRLMVANRTKTWVPVIVDVEGYKQHRNEVLQALATRIADQVRVRSMSFTLSPMPAFERRIIHLTLADHPDVATESTGEGEMRRVVILPRDQLGQD